MGQNPFCSFAKNGGIPGVFGCAERTGRWIRTHGPIEKKRSGTTPVIQALDRGPARFAAQTRQMLVPVLQRDSAFSGGDAPRRIMLPDAIAKERLFAPANRHQRQPQRGPEPPEGLSPPVAV
jgi:hypothetical protein